MLESSSLYATRHFLRARPSSTKSSTTFKHFFVRNCCSPFTCHETIVNQNQISVVSFYRKKCGSAIFRTFSQNTLSVVNLGNPRKFWNFTLYTMGEFTHKSCLTFFRFLCSRLSPGYDVPRDRTTLFPAGKEFCLSLLSRNWTLECVWRHTS